MKSNPQQIAEIRNLLTELKAKFDFISQKKSTKLIGKKVHKKKRKHTVNTDYIYEKKLFDFVRNEKLFGNPIQIAYNDVNSQTKIKVGIFEL